MVPQCPITKPAPLGWQLLTAVGVAAAMIGCIEVKNDVNYDTAVNLPRATGAAGGASITVEVHGAQATVGGGSGAGAGGDVPKPDGPKGEAHWGYEGAIGPEHWGMLSEAWALCSKGKAQSPIDIDTTMLTAGMPAAAVPSYGSSALTIENNGHSIKVTYDSGSTLTIDGSVYELKQFHFHTPSEHKINGMAAPAEVHFVHIAEWGGIAVLGVMIEAGAENAEFAKLVPHITDTKGPKQTHPGMVEAAQYLPRSDGSGSYRYAGSLTTPGCAEGLIWTVMKDPITFSQAQIDALMHATGANARPVQPPHGRPVTQNDDDQNT